MFIEGENPYSEPGFDPNSIDLHINIGIVIYEVPLLSLHTIIVSFQSCSEWRVCIIKEVVCFFPFQVSQTFDITINPVDDSLPVVQNPGMRVQEGVRKTITEFELKATDADTEVRQKLLPPPLPPPCSVVQLIYHKNRFVFKREMIINGFLPAHPWPDHRC